MNEDSVVCVRRGTRQTAWQRHRYLPGNVDVANLMVRGLIGRRQCAVRIPVIRSCIIEAEFVDHLHRHMDQFAASVHRLVEILRVGAVDAKFVLIVRGEPEASASILRLIRGVACPNIAIIREADTAAWLDEQRTIVAHAMAEVEAELRLDPSYVIHDTMPTLSSDDLGPTSLPIQMQVRLLDNIVASMADGLADAMVESDGDAKALKRSLRVTRPPSSRAAQPSVVLLFLNTPHRLTPAMADLVRACGHSTHLIVAAPFLGHPVQSMLQRHPRIRFVAQRASAIEQAVSAFPVASRIAIGMPGATGIEVAERIDLPADEENVFRLAHTFHRRPRLRAALSATLCDRIRSVRRILVLDLATIPGVADLWGRAADTKLKRLIKDARAVVIVVDRSGDGLSLPRTAAGASNPVFSVSTECVGFAVAEAGPEGRTLLVGGENIGTYAYGAMPPGDGIDHLAISPELVIDPNVKALVSWLHEARQLALQM